LVGKNFSRRTLAEARGRGGAGEREEGLVWATRISVGREGREKITKKRGKGKEGLAWAT